MSSQQTILTPTPPWMLAGWVALAVLTGSLAIDDDEGNVFQADLVGFPIGQRRRMRCVRGTFARTLTGGEYPITGRLDLYQIAAGKLVCRLLFADGWSLDLVLDRPR